jgi:hypothetical protein
VAPNASTSACNGSPGWPHQDLHGLEFRDKATSLLLRSRTPILGTRRGRLAGLPRPEITLPIELKRELFDMLSSDVARQLKRRKLSADDVLEDFEASRKRRRVTRRRRLTSSSPPSLVVVRHWHYPTHRQGRTSAGVQIAVGSNTFVSSCYCVA